MGGDYKMTFEKWMKTCKTQGCSHAEVGEESIEAWR
jgi:hypothetical protein